MELVFKFIGAMLVTGSVIVFGGATLLLWWALLILIVLYFINKKKFKPWLKRCFTYWAISLIAFFIAAMVYTYVYSK